jgi:regulator of protease activity HflC (stomatin/prohibitin superfamily)
MEFFLMLLVTVIFPPILLFGFYVVNPREEVVVLNFGKHVDTKRTEGIRWSHPVGRSLRRIPTTDITHHVQSAVVVYRVEDTRKAALDVENFRRFIEDQAGAVIKRVSSRFPYESQDDNEPCLKKENDVVMQTYLDELQSAVAPAGIRVLGVRLNDLTYAPEIAQAMLMRQQAMALIDARKTIVEGAVLIVGDALERLKATGLEVSPGQRDALVSNLLVVLCSGERAQPVLQVQATPGA